MFRGTVTQTSVYPREVVKEARGAQRRSRDPGAQPSLGSGRAVACRRVPDADAEDRAGAGRRAGARSPGGRPRQAMSFAERGLVSKRETTKPYPEFHAAPTQSHQEPRRPEDAAAQAGRGGEREACRGRRTRGRREEAARGSATCSRCAIRRHRQPLRRRATPCLWRPSTPAPCSGAASTRRRARAAGGALRRGSTPPTLLDIDDALSFRRPGIAPTSHASCAKGGWAIQGEIDLHGLRRDEGARGLGAFMRDRPGAACAACAWCTARGWARRATSRCSRARCRAG